MIERYKLIFKEEFENQKKELDELKYVYVIRKGKKIKKPKARPGYRIIRRNGKPYEVRMSSSQRQRLSRIAKRSAKKKKGKMAQSLRKRRMSMRKRKTWKH